MKATTNFTKTFALILAMVMICASFSVYAEETPSDTVITLQIDNPIMTVNGANEEIDPGRGTSPVIVGGRTLVPIRAIIEALGGTVGWDGEKSEVTLTYNADVIKLIINSYSAYLNDSLSTLDVAPAIINERTMLPIRYISESFKFDVKWDGATQTVTITKDSENIIVVDTAASETQDKTSIDTSLDEGLEVLENMEDAAKEEAGEESDDASLNEEDEEATEEDSVIE